MKKVLKIYLTLEEILNKTERLQSKYFLDS